MAVLPPALRPLEDFSAPLPLPESELAVEAAEDDVDEALVAELEATAVVEGW